MDLSHRDLCLTGISVSQVSLSHRDICLTGVLYPQTVSQENGIQLYRSKPLILKSKKAYGFYS